LIEKLEYLDKKSSGKKYPDAGGEDFNIFNETDPADKTSF
jgi:hypothetical protein